MILTCLSISIAKAGADYFEQDLYQYIATIAPYALNLKTFKPPRVFYLISDFIHAYPTNLAQKLYITFKNEIATEISMKRATAAHDHIFRKFTENFQAAKSVEISDANILSGNPFQNFEEIISNFNRDNSETVRMCIDASAHNLWRNGVYCVGPDVAWERFVKKAI